jgi:hypothetical protein
MTPDLVLSVDLSGLSSPGSLALLGLGTAICGLLAALIRRQGEQATTLADIHGRVTAGLETLDKVRRELGVYTTTEQPSKPAGVSSPPPSPPSTPSSTG